MLDLNTMVHFAEIARAGSFAAASRALGVPTSTLSRRIAELEQEVGTRLLHRTSRRLTLTDAGRRYLDYCHRVASEAKAAEEELRARQLRPRGTLRLTTSALFGDLFLGPVIAGYLEHNPDVRVEVLHAQDHVDVVAERIDVALRIRHGRLQDSALVARRLGPAPVVLCASPGYLDARGVPTSPAQLPEHRTIAVRSGPGTPVWSCQTPEESVDVVLRPCLSVNTYPIAAEAAARGLGIVRLPAFIAASYLAEGRLVAVLPDAMPPPPNVFVVFQGPDNVAVIVRSFVDHLVQTLGPVLQGWEGWLPPAATGG